jgi:hypothetical protein
MTSPARPPLTREALAALAASAGLVLTEPELAALLPPTAALFAALDRLDALDLQAAEPAAIFQLPAE